MRYIRETTDFKLYNSAVSLGKFDGVHLGHRLLLNYILSLKEDGLHPTVFTFAMHPSNLLSDRELDIIYTEEEKKSILKEIGMETLISYPFTKQTAEMEPEEFVEKVLVKKLDAKVIAIGSDFRFGYKRSGNAELLKKLSLNYNFEVEIFDKIRVDNEMISSTRIRTELAKGNIELVNRMLGKPYFIEGEVVHGNEFGAKKLEMPTANQIPKQDKLLPPNGVYITKIKIEEKFYKGITNIGYKPTIGKDLKKGIETHIFDFKQDIYGKNIQVFFYAYERGERKFNSIEELKKQMHKDKELGKAYFTKE